MFILELIVLEQFPIFLFSYLGSLIWLRELKNQNFILYPH
jgi:hypothetical protein